MKFYIKVEGRKIIGHPVSAENYKQCFPYHDVNTTPNGYAEFRRCERPDIGPYDYCPMESVYDWDGNTVYDRWDVRPLTEKEKHNLIESFKTKWIEHGGPERNPSWIFDEETARFQPPIPIPSDASSLPPNQIYEWDEESVSWVIKTNEMEFAPQWPMTSPF